MWEINYYFISIVLLKYDSAESWRTSNYIGVALWKNSQFCGFLWKLCEKTLFYHAVPAAPSSDAPHPAAPLSDAASAPHHAAPPPPFYFEDNSVFSEFWRTEAKKLHQRNV